MSEYERIRDAIEKERDTIKKRLEERPKMFSLYGKAYWKGNTEALDWVLTKIAEIHFSTQTARESE